MSIVLHRELEYGLACKSNGVAFPRGFNHGCYASRIEGTRSGAQFLWRKQKGCTCYKTLSPYL